MALPLSHRHPLWSGRSLAFALTLLLSLWPTIAHAALFYYTYGKKRGGVAVLEVDEKSGAISRHEALGPADLTYPKKLALSHDGNRLLVTSDEEPTAWLYHLDASPRRIATLALKGKTSDVSARGNRAWVVQSKGEVSEIDLETSVISQRWNAREALAPPGRKGEFLLWVDGNEPPVALLSFQKDSPSGKHKGHRLAILEVEPISIRHDLPLPRDRPEFHLPGDRREQGPGPELILLAEKSRTLMLSLDLYGAIAFADLDAALAGRWERYEAHPSSLSGRWGEAFPDRALLFEEKGKEYLLVSNASAEGGFALFDIARRRLIQKIPAQAGAETPVRLPASGALATVISGKTKASTPGGLLSTSNPGNNLFLFDPSALGEGEGALKVTAIPFASPLYRIATIGSSPLLLLALRDQAGASFWIVYDTHQRKEITRIPALGEISRLKPAP